MFQKKAAIAILLGCLTIPAFAQAQAPQRQRQQGAKAEKRAQQPLKGDADVAKLRKALKLTDAQANQVQVLVAERNQELQNLRSNKGQKGQAQAIRQKFQSDLRGLLTPEQVQVLDRKQAKKKR